MQSYHNGLKFKLTWTLFYLYCFLTCSFLPCPRGRGWGKELEASFECGSPHPTGLAPCLIGTNWGKHLCAPQLPLAAATGTLDLCGNLPLLAHGPPCVQLRQQMPHFLPNFLRYPGAHVTSGSIPKSHVCMLQRYLHILPSCSAGRKVGFGWITFLFIPGQKFILPIVRFCFESNFVSF